jgi:hypothetical protein
MVAASSETATPGRQSSVISWGLLCCPRGRVTPRNGFNHCFSLCGGDRVCSAGPADPKIGRSRRNWKLPLVMHSIGGGIVVQKRCARLRPVRLQLAIEERAVLEVSGGVGRHERALRVQPFSIASQRFENAMCQPRSVPSAGQLLRHLRVEQGEAAFSWRLRARRRRMALQAAGLSRIRPRQAGRAACVWTNGDGWWIRRAIRGLTFPPRRRAARSTLFARRRAGLLRSGTIARELHAAPNIIPVLHGTNGRLEPTGPAGTLSSRSRGRVN